MDLLQEIAKRRTFAIISHPDAGKTTLTEKFLLYGGAAQAAGSVVARKVQRAATSDWMELERKRGISITSTVLRFDYRGCSVNLLDTPGHNDFSEDTYRVLMAVDAAVMVVDAGKGIESQTRKLFEVCRMRRIPIFTFMNKLDRPSLSPLELIDELENVLGIAAYPVTWPLGNGPDFRGVFDRPSNQVHLFERVSGGTYRAPFVVADLQDDAVRRAVGVEPHRQAVEELAILDGAGHSFDAAAVRDGELSPVFFGSAVNNFGVQLLLDGFLDRAPCPSPRASTAGKVAPDNPAFSAFVFKIQSNMDPRHRDQIAFLRICSGKFTRDMKVLHARTGKSIRLTSSHKLFGRERETIDEAYPGDVIGIVGHSDLTIGDTLTEDPTIVYREIPRFAPECFALLHRTNASEGKRFNAGLQHLLQEGVVQSFRLKDSPQATPVLAAVGPLQFEVLQYRLNAEYGATSRLEPATWTMVLWPEKGPELDSLTEDDLPSGSRLAEDDDGRTAILFPGEWAVRMFRGKHPDLGLAKLPGENPDGAGRVLRAS